MSHKSCRNLLDLIFALAGGGTVSGHCAAAAALPLLQVSTVGEPISVRTGVGWRRQWKGEN